MMSNSYSLFLGPPVSIIGNAHNTSWFPVMHILLLRLLHNITSYYTHPHMFSRTAMSSEVPRLREVSSSAPSMDLYTVDMAM